MDGQTHPKKKEAISGIFVVRFFPFRRRTFHFTDIHVVTHD
jgi:hypothetical protein